MLKKNYILLLLGLCVLLVWAIFAYFIFFGLKTIGEVPITIATPTEMPTPANTPIPTPTQTPLPPGRIAFVSNRDGNPEIYAINTDGSGLTNLTNDAAFDVEPAWSRDGRKLAFVSNRTGKFEVFMMNADGSNVEQVVDMVGVVKRPAWSSDGKKIAFDSYQGQFWAIYIINLDDRTGLMRAMGTSPDWSPNGKYLVYDNNTEFVVEENRHGFVQVDSHIFVVDLNTLNEMGELKTTQLTTTGNNYYPTWSPDGKRIAYTMESGRDIYVYVMNVDGTGQRQIGPSGSYEPCWSPDGKQLAVTDAGRISIFEVDGNGARVLVDGPGLNRDPTWTH